MSVARADHRSDAQVRSRPHRWSCIADFTRADVALLLRRAGFGGTKAEIDALSAKPSWAAVVDQVLDTSANPPDTIPPAIDDTTGTNEFYPAWVAAVHYWVDRMATTPTPLVEKLTLFWHGLLVTSTSGPLASMVFRQIQTYRRLGLGDMHTLLQAMAIDPAMLKYLDNDRNVAAAPNENFARELMELFTLGNGRFTEADVVSMARAWTGHTLTPQNTYQFLANKHDNANKTLFGITKNWDGPDTITEIVRGSKQSICARYLVTRLWSFFAGPVPSAALVDSLAASLIGGGMNTRAFLRVLFNRPEFRSTATRTGLVRSPVEWMIATMRATGLDAETMHPEWWLYRLGQVLYRPPNVAGWKQNAGWISSSAQWGKGFYASNVRWQAVNAGVLNGIEDLPPAAAVQRAFDQFAIDEPATGTRQQLEAYVAREQAARRNWTIPAGLVGLAMLTPDFQLA